MCDIEKERADHTNHGSCNEHARCIDVKAEVGLARAGYRMIPFDFHHKERSDRTSREGCEYSDRCRDHGLFGTTRDAKDLKQSAQGTFLWHRISFDSGANAITDLRTDTCGIKMNYLNKILSREKRSPYVQCGTDGETIARHGDENDFVIRSGYLTGKINMTVTDLKSAGPGTASCSVCDPLLNTRIREIFEEDPGKDWGWLKSSTWHFFDDHSHTRNMLQTSVSTGLCAKLGKCADRLYQFVPHISDSDSDMCKDSMRMVDNEGV